MTPQILTTLVILLLAILLFISEKLRIDLVALLVLAALALGGLVTPAEALSGFSNSAVVTVWAVFVLSGGLSRTGVASVIGRQVLRLAGQGETRLLLVIMLLASLMSAFMNNIGVAALMLPVVINIGRQTRIPASRLLMPLAYGTLLGGMLTLIGTPPNILAADALAEFGFTPFRMFDFAPVGLVVVLAGIVFMLVIGRRLVPSRHPLQSLAAGNHEMADPRELFGLEELLALVAIPEDSPLAGRTLAESRIGRALGLNILGLQRQGRTQMTIQPQTVLRAGDRLLALGRLNLLEALSQRRPLILVEDDAALTQQLSQQIRLAELTVNPGSRFVDQTIAQLQVRQAFGVNVLAIQHQGRTQLIELQDLALRPGDRLLLQGSAEKFAELQQTSEFQGLQLRTLAELPESAFPGVRRQLLLARVPEHSSLVDRTLLQSRLGNAFDLVALGLIRAGEPVIVPEPDTLLQAGDFILVQGDPDELNLIRGLQSLIVHRHLNLDRVTLETESVGLSEAVLSPYATMVNKTLREIHFREKYGLSVLAIWRSGRAYRSDLGNMALRFGDAFLLYGPRDRIDLLGREPDFLVLQEGAGVAPRLGKAPLAALIMVGVVLVVLLGWVPIAIAAITGAALMVATGCLQMEEAYQFIDWRSVFLIAGMLPLGIAMEQSGAARFLAEGMVSLVGGLGPRPLIAGLFVLTSVASQFMPNAVVTVLMAPIAVNTALDLNLSPPALMMVIAVAASSSFMSPVGHPANILIMGPGGYRFGDYLKVGIPLTLLVLVIVLWVLPFFWPLAAGG